MRLAVVISLLGGYVAEEESVSNDTVTAKGATLNSNQERGYKSTLKNPNVSDEAKRHAQQVLEESGASY
ncbi:Conidiation protein 6-domain-containing protein [Pholiota molesta]|nr:Conidiation protein 6-domain-containing protein [Pholiota molesta]